MIAVLSKDAPLRYKAAVVRLAEDAGLTVHVSDTPGYCLIGVVGEGAEALADPISKLDGVVEVDLSAPAYALVSRAHRPVSSLVRVGDAQFGDGGVHVIAGPCSVESLDQIMAAAHAVKAAGACALRGGAFKPRTSPYAFQGLGAQGLELLKQAREATGLPVVTEVLDVRDLQSVAESADVMQVGARNMQNYALLRELGGVRRTVLLKRGMAGTLDELLHAAEYIVSNGNPNVILCERGVRTHIGHARATLDLAAIAVLKERTHLPVIVDPSHAAGRRALVGPLALAAVAAGADGLIIEVHPEPDVARSDKAQQLLPEDFARLMARIKMVKQAITMDLSA